MKVALITDTHFGARGDSQIFSDSFREFYSDTFFPYLKEHDIKHVVHLGDVFDRRKYINYRSLKECKEFFFDPMLDMGIQCNMLVGNHDSYFKGSLKVNSPKLLLSEYDNLNIIDSPQELLSPCSNQKWLMLPWICEENREESESLIANSTAEVVFGHLEVEGFEMHHGALCSDGYKSSDFSRFRKTFSGHFHHRSDNGKVYYLGNPYQIYWGDYQDVRGFHVYDTKNSGTKFVSNPKIMFKKVFYDDSEETLVGIRSKDYSDLKGCYVKLIVTNKDNPYWLEVTIDMITKANPVDLKVVESSIDVVFDEEFCVDDAQGMDTLSLISHHIGAMKVGGDEQRLKQLMSELYYEALAIDKSA